MPQEKMEVQGTNLLIEIKEGRPPGGLDELVVTDGSGNVTHKITPFDDGRRIEGVYPLTFDGNGNLTVGHDGVVNVNSKGRLPQCYNFNVLTGEMIKPTEEGILSHFY